MQNFIESGAIVILMLVVVALEAVALIVYFRRTGRGIAPLKLLTNLGAGTSLMLALGSVLYAYPWWTTAALLVLSAVFHTADLVCRWHGDNT
ncbi:MAG: hypothetical protein AAGA23_00615 [Pseudomonadota bacterium]